MLPIAHAEAAGDATVSAGDRNVPSQVQPVAARDLKADYPKPPKKPLTPYMIFSKQVCGIVFFIILNVFVWLEAQLFVYRVNWISHDFISM